MPPQLLNLHNIVTHIRTQKAKMYFKNIRERSVDHQPFFLRLEGLTLSSIHLRFFWTSYISSDGPDLLFNHAEHLVLRIISYMLVRDST